MACGADDPSGGDRARLGSAPCPASPTSSSCCTAGTRRRPRTTGTRSGWPPATPTPTYDACCSPWTRRCRWPRRPPTWDADLLLTHHPLFLRGVHGVAETTPKGRTLATLTRAGCGLLTAHTNADHGTPGRLRRPGPRARPARRTTRSRRSGPPLDKIVVFAPRRRRGRDPRRAGRGRGRPRGRLRHGLLQRGRARAGSGRWPEPTRRSARIGELEVTDELRIEARAAARTGGPSRPGRARGALLRGGRLRRPRARPTPAPAPTGAGRIGDVDETTLGEYADRVAGALPPTARGVLVGGDPDRVVRRVAVTGGAGDFLLDRALSQRRRRLRHQRPAAPRGGRVPGEGRAVAARRVALGGRVDLAPGAGGAARRGPGRYGGDPGEHALHRRMAGPRDDHPRTEPHKEPA